MTRSQRSTTCWPTPKSIIRIILRRFNLRISQE
jgi:hypothetical protein